MDLSQKNEQNIEYMIDAIKSKLKMASASALQSSAFTVDQYDDILDIYEIVNSKSNLSISEVEALVSELGRLRA
ncbi:DUF1128 domain-containing protein [Neobacillus mesonae]|nr:DUF1128 domain-containing protein [Neobacillus mesonae]